MATKTIAWSKGGGYITLTYTGTGNNSVSVKSDANGLFEDREQTVRLVTTNGSPQKAVNLLVRQKGKSYSAGTVFDYGYTGSVQQVELPPGKYKLQCWGAQGGSVKGDYAATGSKGGYSEGILTVTKLTTIYIFVGGKGVDSPTSLASGTDNGGWNGGGSSVRRSSYSNEDTTGFSYPRSGGGATDMCLVTSAMEYSSGRTNRSRASLLSRFIVAGGGAGASAACSEEKSVGEPTLRTQNVGFTLEQGTWRESIGCRADSSNSGHSIRIRSNNVISLNKGDRYTLQVNSGYQLFVIFFSEYVSNAIEYTGNTVGIYYTWEEPKEFYAVTYDKIAVIIRKTNNSAISVNDNHGLVITRHYYDYGGISHTEENVPNTVEQGTWSEKTGARLPSSSQYHNTRLRTNEAVHLTKNDRYLVSVNAGYRVFLIFFSNYVTNAIGNESNTVGDVLSYSQVQDFSADYEHMAAIIIKTDESAISANDDHGLTITHYKINPDISSSSTTSNASQQGGGVSGRGEFPGTQSDAGGGGDFGLGADQSTTNYRYAAGAGGGGWYGGGTDYSDTDMDYVNYSGGGSGFVNTSANASHRPDGFTGLQLDSGSTKDGAQSFPSPSSGNETGHSGNGHAKITVLE